MTTSDVPSINYTVKELVKEIREEQKKQHETLHSIENHVKKTNGRVTALEAKSNYLQRRSLGVWVTEHPRQVFIYAVIIALLLAITTSEGELIKLVQTFI